MSKQIFKGIKSVTGSFFNGVNAIDKKGYIWFVRTVVEDAEGESSPLSNDIYDIYFGTKHYGHFQEGQFETIANDIQLLKNNDSTFATLHSKLAEVLGLSKDWDKITVNEVEYETLNAVFVALSQRVDTLEKIDHDAYKSADNALKEELQGEIDKKVTAEDGKRLMTDAEGTKLAGVAEGAEVNKIEVVTVNGIQATIAEGTKEASVKIEADDIELGTAIESDGEVVYDSTKKVSEVLQSIQDSIAVAVSGGLTGVVAGNGVEVSAVAANKQTVSVKVSTAEGNMIIADENGLYAAMYYDGDDIE